MSNAPQGRLVVATPFCDKGNAFSTYHLIVNGRCEWCQRLLNDLKADPPLDTERTTKETEEDLTRVDRECCARPTGSNATSNQRRS